jgi:tetratricopeptide (TPR) repeat protein
MQHRMTQDQPLETDQQGLRELIEGKPAVATGLGVAFIIIATLLAYVPAMRGDFVWDDDYYVRDNSLLRSWDGLQRIWFDIFPEPSAYSLPQYYPMTHTSFWIEYRLWGLNPTGYHFVNVVLHICNALLIWLLLRKLDVPGGFLASAIFALHPLNVESVAWIAERKNVLCLMFYLSALYVYLRYAGVIKGREKKPYEQISAEENAGQIEWFTLPDDPQRLYGLAAVLFLCALFSKTIASSMPAVALLLIWWKRGKLTARDIGLALPLLVVGAAMGGLTAYMERERVGIKFRAEEWDYSPTLFGEFFARGMIAGKALWFYVQKLVLPYPLIFNYERWKVPPDNPIQYLFVIAAIVVVLALALSRKRLGNGPLVAVLFYVGTLFPALGFVNVWPMRYSFVADHFAYISIIGLIALFAAVVRKYLNFEGVAGVTTVVLLVFFGMSFARAAVFRDNETLWRETWLQSGKTSWMAANNYGRLMFERNEFPVAEAWFNTVIRLKPDHPEARLNLARIAERRGELAEKLRAQAAATRPTTQLLAMIPTTKPAEYYEQAIQYYLEAIELEDDYVDAHYFLAQRLLAMGRTDEAVKHFRTANELYEDRHELAHLELGLIDVQAKRLEEARKHFIRVIEINPYSVRGQAELGTVLLQEGHLAEGLTAWEEALRISNDDAPLLNEFGAKMARSGEFLKAHDYFRRAMDVDPDNVEAMTNMGVTAALAGYPDRARDWFNRALRTDPKFKMAAEQLKALEEGRLVPATKPSTRPATTSSSER